MKIVAVQQVIFTMSTEKIMNYLAHAYLSFNDPGILAGNMISDFVKGKKQFEYALRVQKGILLHRSIDTFTDMHDATRELKSYFSPHYRLYAGAFVDIVYDYFLANDSMEFETGDALRKFASNTYSSLEKELDLLPLLFQSMFPFMKEQNWLYNYRYKTFIQRSFRGLVQRAAYLSESEVAFEIFDKHSQQMCSSYDKFIPELKNFAIHKLQELLNA